MPHQVSLLADSLRALPPLQGSGSVDRPVTVLTQCIPSKPMKQIIDHILHPAMPRGRIVDAQGHTPRQPIVVQVLDQRRDGRET